MKPIRSAISSRQAIRTPWRCSSTATYWPASSIESWVPVSSQAQPRPRSSRRASPRCVWTRGGGVAQVARDVGDVVVVEVEPGDGAVAPGLRGLLLDGDQVPGLVGLADAVALGVADGVADNGGALVGVDLGDGVLEHRGEALAVEDVVAQDEGGGVVADVLGADEEGLGQP